MVKAIVNLGEYEDRVLTIVKGKYGLKNKSDALNFVINKFDEELLEPELRPEFVKEIQHIKNRGKFKEYKGVSELRKALKDA